MVFAAFAAITIFARHSEFRLVKFFFVAEIHSFMILNDERRDMYTLICNIISQILMNSFLHTLPMQSQLIFRQW